jgi:magnesium transporter
MDKDLLISGGAALTKEALSEMHVADIAEYMEDMDEQDAIRVFRMLPKDYAAEVFAYLPHEIQQNIVEGIADREIGGIINELFLDDAVDFIEEMPANVVKRILAAVPRGKRDIINQFLKYPEDSAGSIMTIEYVALKKGITVKKAFAEIRAKAIEKETIYTCYVIDSARCLIGLVSVLTLLLSDPDQLIGDIMDTNIISAQTTANKEDLVGDFSKYDLLALPVVDSENRLVGIVTIDDALDVALDVAEEEATEDFELMAAITPSEDPYMKTGVWMLCRNRIPWLMILMVTAMMTGGIISFFEATLETMTSLAIFIPLLMDTGGNAGCQSSTLIIRGMAVGDIRLKDVLRVLWKETRVAVICGFALVIVNYARMVVMGTETLLAVTVSLTLYLTVVLAKTIGCLLPMGAKKLRLDPAMMAAPVITSIVDASALFIYFTLATVILSI